MNFSIAIKLDVNASSRPTNIAKHILSNGRELQFVDMYCPMFDLDNIANALGFIDWPQGFGKKVLEMYFSTTLGPTDSVALSQALMNKGADYATISEVRDFIRSKGKYRDWTAVAALNTHGL